jgi:hypothetical protein
MLVLHISAVSDPNKLTEHLLSIVHTGLKARISTSAANGSQEMKVAGSSGVVAGSSSNSTGSPEEMIQKFITVSLIFARVFQRLFSIFIFCRRLVLMKSPELTGGW